MRIACPSCAAEYEVPAARLKPGRSARCAGCGTQWAPEIAAEPAPATEQASGPAPEPAGQATAEPADLPPPVPASGSGAPVASPADRPAAALSQPAASSALLGAWLLTFLILAGAAGAAVMWRTGIMRTWPPSSHILALF